MQLLYLLYKQTSQPLSVSFSTTKVQVHTLCG